ncbi:MAG: hypothetical protein IMY68_11900, partial [Bacteroidetes bacterium]|nr:hypothetical protein [Bacteroidota bacterium]
MKIKGEFRDVLSRNGEIIEDRGWRSNTIVEEFGNFLAAVMKKDFQDDSNNTIKPVGIEYMAVGSKSNTVDEFRKRVENFFTAWNDEIGFDPAKPRGEGDPWIWVKKIESDDITYLNAADNQVTHMLQI